MNGHRTSRTKLILGSRVSSFEKLEILSVTGGVPRYLELIDTRRSAEDNLRQLLFSKNSVLLNEFDPTEVI